MPSAEEKMEEKFEKPEDVVLGLGWFCFAVQNCDDLASSEQLISHRHCDDQLEAITWTSH